MASAMGLRSNPAEARVAGDRRAAGRFCRPLRGLIRFASLTHGSRPWAIHLPPASRAAQNSFCPAQILSASSTKPPNQTATDLPGPAYPPALPSRRRPPVSRRLTGCFTGLQDGCVHFYFLYFVMVTGSQPVFYRLYTGASRKTLKLLLCFYNFIIAYVSSVETFSRHAPVENKANKVRTASTYRRRPACQIRGCPIRAARGPTTAASPDFGSRIGPRAAPQRAWQSALRSLQSAICRSERRRRSARARHPRSAPPSTIAATWWATRTTPTAAS